MIDMDMLHLKAAVRDLEQEDSMVGATFHLLFLTFLKIYLGIFEEIKMDGNVRQEVQT